MKTFKALGYCIIAFAVFNVSMFTTSFIIDKENENEPSISNVRETSENSTTKEEIQTNEIKSRTEDTKTATEKTTNSKSNESTQEEVTYQAPTFTPANTEEYTVNEYMGYDNNLNGDSYYITRNSDGMKGVLTIDSQANMQWYYFNAEGIHTN